MAEFFGPVHEFMEERIPNRIDLSSIKNAAQNLVGRNPSTQKQKTGAPSDSTKQSTEGSDSSTSQQSPASQTALDDVPDFPLSEKEDSMALADAKAIIDMISMDD